MAINDIQADIESKRANLEKLSAKLAKNARRFERSNQRLKETINALSEPINVVNLNDELQTRIAQTVDHITTDPTEPIEHLDWIGPKFETVANLRPHELQSKRTSKADTDELFTHEDVTGTVTLGVACRAMEYLLRERDDNTQPPITVNSANVTNPTTEDFDFEHTFYDKRPFDFQKEHSKDNPSETDTEPGTVIDANSLYYTDYNKWNFTLPPDPISCRSLINTTHADTDETTSKQTISDEQIAWLNEHIFTPGYLTSIQAAEMKELDESPERLAQLENDLKKLSDEIGTDYEWHLKPTLFPEDL